MKAALPKKTLGKTSLQVSELGFGAASLGNLYKEVKEQDANDTLAASIELGLNLYDTAPRYGLGLSERRVGNALRSLNREDYILSTKVGRILKADIPTEFWLALKEQNIIKESAPIPNK